ncbi:MAG: TdeIII family type II restriction endonuclease [Calditrichaeota bacterium]|nr:TdeIII family type II restriction endonuclease [Calditrichota bacterium]
MPITDSQIREISNLLKCKITDKLREYSPETQAMPFHVRLLGRDRMALYSFIHSIINGVILL